MKLPSLPVFLAGLLLSCAFCSAAEKWVSDTPQTNSFFGNSRLALTIDGDLVEIGHLFPRIEKNRPTGVVIPDETKSTFKILDRKSSGELTALHIASDKGELFCVIRKDRMSVYNQDRKFAFTLTKTDDFEDNLKDLLRDEEARQLLTKFGPPPPPAEKVDPPSE